MLRMDIWSPVQPRAGSPVRARARSMSAMDVESGRFEMWIPEILRAQIETDRSCRSDTRQRLVSSREVHRMVCRQPVQLGCDR